MKFPHIEITPKRRRIVLRTALILASAFVLTFFLEYRHFLNNSNQAWFFVNAHSSVFIYSSLIMALALLLLSTIFRKPWTSVGIMTVLIIVVGYVHISKYEFRSNPLLPEDFMMAEQAGTLTNFVDFGGLIRMLIAVVLTIALTILLNRLTGRFFLRNKSEEPKKWWKRHDVAPRVALAVIAFMGLLVSTDFVRHHDGKRYMDVEWLDTYFMAWNQDFNYSINGFILGFLYNLDKFELQPPDGYSENQMAEIANKYAVLAEENNINKKTLADADYNIVVILNESFYDASYVKDVYPYSGDATPEWHKIAEKYPSGLMYSTDFGGGTANIEFEVFTGLSNYWADTVPYTDILPKINSVRSVASLAKENGYETLAIHPYNGGMYKRDFALIKQGFDKFITEKEMDFTDRVQGETGELGSITDQAAYSQVLKEISDSDKRLMVGLITMQNHAPYLPEWFSNPKFKMSVKDEYKDWEDVEDYEAELAKASAYLEILHSSDAYLGEFIRKLDDFNEKTVVLFYGDHAPGVFSRVDKVRGDDVKDLSRMTPYFIYANFEMPKQNGLAQLKLPTTTPNCLTNTMYNILDIKKPALNYLLDEVCAQTPILAPFYLGADGPFQSTEISEYEMINYDVLGGKQYWYKFTKD